MRYNQEKHYQLLELSKKLQINKKSLYQEDYTKFIELFKYNAAIQEHVFWEYRFQISRLINDFLNEVIDQEEFCQYSKKLINDVEKFILNLSSGVIKDFQPNIKSEKLSSFITFLYCECENFSDYDDYKNEEFYTLIKQGFVKFQQILNEK